MYGMCYNLFKLGRGSKDKELIDMDNSSLAAAGTVPNSRTGDTEVISRFV